MCDENCNGSCENRPNRKRVKETTFDAINALLDGKVLHIKDDMGEVQIGMVKDLIVVQGMMGRLAIRQFMGAIKFLPEFISKSHTVAILTPENIKDYVIPSNPEDEVTLEIIKEDLEDIYNEGISQKADQDVMNITRLQIIDMLSLATAPTKRSIQ